MFVNIIHHLHYHILPHRNNLHFHKFHRHLRNYYQNIHMSIQYHSHLLQYNNNQYQNLLHHHKEFQKILQVLLLNMIKFRQISFTRILKCFLSKVIR